jgi:hypothetical protein
MTQIGMFVFFAGVLLGYLLGFMAGEYDSLCSWWQAQRHPWLEKRASMDEPVSPVTLHWQVQRHPWLEKRASMDERVTSVTPQWQGPRLTDFGENTNEHDQRAVERSRANDSTVSA